MFARRSQGAGLRNEGPLLVVPQLKVRGVAQTREGSRYKGKDESSRASQTTQRASVEGAGGPALSGCLRLLPVQEGSGRGLAAGKGGGCKQESLGFGTQGEAKAEIAKTKGGMRGAGPGERAREAREAVAECRAAYEALNRFTASYRQLVLGVGSSADGRRLRRALEESGRRGFELSLGLRNQLLAELTGPGAGQDEEVKMELERLWVLCMSALEIFLQDLGRAHDLSQLFPMPSSPAHGTQLISTGVTSFGSKGWSLRRSSSGKASERTGELPEELAQWGQRLEEMLLEMETKVNVPVWSVEATLGGPGAEEPSPEASAGRSAPGCCTRDPLRFQSHCIVA